MVCYAEKQEKPFWFSSLGQIVQFGEIIFCRTFKNYFGQCVWIEKKSHYNSRVSLHEAPTKTLNAKVDTRSTKLGMIFEIELGPVKDPAIGLKQALINVTIVLERKLCWLTAELRHPDIVTIAKMFTLFKS